MSGSARAPKDTIAANCAVVMDRLNLKSIPNLGMCENFDDSIEYHWKTGKRNIRVLVLVDKFVINIHDKFTGSLESGREYSYDEPAVTIDYIPTSIEAA